MDDREQQPFNLAEQNPKRFLRIRRNIERTHAVVEENPRKKRDNEEKLMDAGNGRAI